MLIEALSGNDESGSCGGVNSVQGQPVLHPVRYLVDVGFGAGAISLICSCSVMSVFSFSDLMTSLIFCAPGNSGCVAVTTVEVGVAGVSLTGFHSAATQQYTGPSR